MQSLRRIIGIGKPVVRVLPLVGPIVARRGNSRRNMDFASVEKQIEEAFECKKATPKAVVLKINSQGGSPVQSNLMYKRIRNLADKTKVPVISYIEDMAASGGYWLALAGDEIYADPSSVVGSIGAIHISFGLQDTCKKLGFDSRVFQAGKHKYRLNPFLPQNPDDAVWLNNFLGEIHENFKNLVKERRKSLDLKHKTVFEGDVFSGQRATEIGLIDGVHSDLNKFVKDRYGDDVVMKKIEEKRKFPFSFNNFGTELKVDAGEIIQSISAAGAESKYKAA